MKRKILLTLTISLLFIATGLMAKMSTDQANGSISIPVLYIGNTADGIAWHESSYNDYEGGESWYAGDKDIHQYGTSAIYYLTSPEIDLTTACSAQLTCNLDYDIEAPGGEDPPYNGWDVANVQISIDDGTSWEFLEDPNHPYNVTIANAGFFNTHNPADTLYYPGWGGVPDPDEWFDFSVDLADYVGETVKIRYALASDPASTSEGYWVDNVEVTADGTPIFTDTDQENMIPADPIIPIGESRAEKVTIKAYLNLQCDTGGGREVKNLLDGLVQEYKGRVSVEYIDFGTRDGYNRMVKDGLNCQGLIINGKQTYIINDSNGKQREVTFSHPLNAQYTDDDLKIVVKSLLGDDRR